MVASLTQFRLFLLPPTLDSRPHLRHFPQNPPCGCYKYKVEVTKKGKKSNDDPRIILDGGLPGLASFPDPDKIATAAELAWEKLFGKISNARKVEGVSAVQLYPHGITDIEVSVGFAGVTITVKVSGPDTGGSKV